ncbi:hypothetical protein C365_02452 [Cryptococcus neoformans Bt85]|nr:hypothetical protein C365_02452 [Cryptococcus neoformans var. grubii Bt85]
MTPASASSQPGSCDNVTLNSPLASRPATPEENAVQGENGECPSERPPSLASPQHHRPQLDRVLSRSLSSSSRSFDVPDGHEQHTLSFQNTSSPSLHALEREHFPPILEGKATGNGIEAEDGDLSAPFESIPLSSTPLREAPTVPLPSSPREMLSPKSVKKRRSWGGFGMSSDGHQTARGELPEHPAPHTSQSAGPLQPTHDKHNGEGLPERASTATPTPRRAAPPPHPFPWPIPTSPPPSSSKRLSTISNASSGTHATQASQGSASATCPHAPGQGQAQTHQHAPGLGVKGVSTFEKVISHTRPSWLPPKDRIEDVTHLHQWEDMMRHAREHEKVLAKQAEIRRLEKEKRLAAEAPKWEKLLSDEKDFSVKKVKENEALRKLWFEGVPSHLRGKAWSMAVGNPLALSKDIYKTYLARARKGLATGRFPPDLLKTIEGDMDNTLVTLKVFTRGSPLRDDLRELICAWLVFRSDEGLGYAPYINLLCAMLLLASPPPAAFLTLLNILSRPLLRAFFTPLSPEISAYYRILENLQADRYPKIYANCKALGVGVPENWFRSLLVEQVGFESSCRLWDQIMLDGDGFVFRAALAIFGYLEPRLYYPDKQEVLSVLEGHNPASLAILQRERERARLRGETFVQEGIDGTLSAFGLDEGKLFGMIEGDGWREKDFERLVMREMPDY